MSFIYLITNNVNGKQYVGKTEKTVEERFKQHIKDSSKTQCQDRPLYRAFLKYGVENFSYSVIEECSRNDSAAREVYWIGKLDTYKKGYNATIGGDGKPWRDYKTIAEKYQELQHESQVANFFGCDNKTVREACKEYGVPIVSCGEQNKKLFGKSVDMIDLDGNIVRHFSNMSDAGRFLIESGICKSNPKHASTYIGRAARSERKNAYGFYWRFSDNNGE